MSHHHKCECKKEFKEREHRERESGGIFDCLCGGNNGWLMFLIFVLLIIGVSGILDGGFI
ncbi:MAG: hypothetical protein K6U80_05015 [Firmicutes bacterium]|nr:hypothetical protein [Bacillota bacterium]